MTHVIIKGQKDQARIKNHDLISQRAIRPLNCSPVNLLNDARF